jgi:hypothetical protein
MMKLRLFSITLFFAVLMAACNGPSLPVTSTPPAEEQAAPQATAAAQQALASFLGVSLDAVKLEKIEDAQWPNGCLGLQAADELCTEALVPGYRFSFTVNGQPYEVRTNLDGLMVRVANAQAEGEIPTPAAVDKVRQDLASRLGLALDQIQVTSVEPMEWSDGCLGLGKPDESCLMAIVSGYRITLSANGTTYTFRTDDNGSQIREETAAVQPVEQGVVINWNRSGGIAGFCDSLLVFQGDALASSCRNNNTQNRVMLTPQQITTLQGWTSRLGSFTIEQKDPASAADAMSVSLIFTGTGTESPSDADKTALLEFVEQLYTAANQ